MITIARIINAWRDSEQFVFPVEDRSKLWHYLIYPQYFFTLIAIPVYFFVFKFNFVYALAIDLFFQYIFFELFLRLFKKKMRNG